MVLKNFKYILLASAVTLGGCATTLEHRTPVDIASNSVQVKYPDTGVSEILAPPVKTFTELRAKVKGMAQLRTAGPFTDNKGGIFEGGAYLDILINYKSATPDPLETRQYSQAKWPDGEIAQLADFGASVLDCRADIRNVRRFPFGNGYYGNGSYGYGGYGYGYGYGNNSRRHHNRRNRNSHSNNRVNDHTDNTDYDRDRDHTGTNSTTDASVARPVHPPKPPRRVRPTNDPAPQPDGPGTEPGTGPYFNPGSHPYSGSGSGSDSGRSHQAAQPHTSTRAAPSSAHTPSARRAHTQTQQHRASPSRRNTSSSRSHRSNSGNNSSRGHSSSSSSGSSSSGHSSSRSHRSGRHLNYYPTNPFYNPGYIDTVVRRYCERQENLRVFVPRERLDAAKYSGITLLIRPRGGREEVLSLPPNYIAGFMLAAWTPEGRNMTIPGYPLPPPASQPKGLPQETQQETLAPLPVPEQPDPKKPIIYGEN